MTGSIVQVSLSPGGVPKTAVPEARVYRLGLEGDGHAHPMVHGGLEKAVLLIMEEALAEMVSAGFQVFPGALGENVTTRYLDRRSLRIGQRLRLGGEVVLEITRLRQPCRQIGIYGRGIQEFIYDDQVRVGDPRTPRWGLAGFYGRVLESGVIRPGDPIVLLEAAA